jgi:hypothetical protein
MDFASNTASIQTGGGDIAGLHAYSLGVGIDTNTGDTDVGASYGYSGWRPGIRFAGARTLVTRGGWRIDGVPKRFQEEDWAGTFAVAIPLESRPTQSWSLQFDYSLDWYRLIGPPPYTLDPNTRVPVRPPTDYTEASLGVRVGFSSARSTTFALGSVDGFDASFGLRLDDPAFGSAYRFITASYAADWYHPLFGVTSVLALRIGGGIRAGDLVRPGGYALGGVPAQDVAMSIVNSVRTSASGYLRGYDYRTVYGNQYHLANVELRQELWNIEHGLATLPVYFRRLHAALLSDVATAFDTTLDPSTDIRWSVGGALRVDAYFGYFVPGTFEVGYSRGLIQGGVNETWFLLTGSL